MLKSKTIKEWVFGVTPTKRPYRTPAVRSVYPMDTGPVDVPKKRCEAICCKDGGKDFVPMPLVIHCPQCGLQHVDEGEFATKKHRVHRCVTRVIKFQAQDGEAQSEQPGCGFEWQPAHVFTVGVEKII